ncbi:hypothetical protein SLA2020_230110 [Shorea laevis]
MQRSRSAKPTTIHGCAQAGDLVAFQRLLRDNPSLFNERNAVMSQTPLHVSAGYNRADMVKLLLDWQGPEKVELEAKNMYGETPLHMAAKNGCNEAARLLLAHGAFIEAKANNGMTHCILLFGTQFDLMTTQWSRHYLSTRLIAVLRTMRA